MSDTDKIALAGLLLLLLFGPKTLIASTKECVDYGDGRGCVPVDYKTCTCPAIGPCNCVEY